MRVHVIERIGDYEILSLLGVFSTRERALGYLSEKKITIYRHVGTRETWCGWEPYDTWSIYSNGYRNGDLEDKVIESMEIGITERDGNLGYYAPDGRHICVDCDYEIEEFEVDNGE